MAVIMIHATRMLIALFMSNFNKALDAAVLLPLNMLILGGTAYFLGWLWLQPAQSRSVGFNLERRRAGGPTLTQQHRTNPDAYQRDLAGLE